MKRTPIGKIGEDQKKLTIADEIEHESTYRFEPSLSPEELFYCWLDPSERAITEELGWMFWVGKHKTRIAGESVEILRQYIKPEAFDLKLMRIEKESRHGWQRAKRKIMRKYNLTKLNFATMAKSVNEITIGSLQPLYDEDAHANRVRNVLRAVKIHHPNVTFGPPDCKQALSCPRGLNEALRKVALETHGKEIA